MPAVVANVFSFRALAAGTTVTLNLPAPGVGRRHVLLSVWASGDDGAGGASPFLIVTITAVTGGIIFLRGFVDVNNLGSIVGLSKEVTGLYTKFPENSAVDITVSRTGAFEVIAGCDIVTEPVRL